RLMSIDMFENDEVDGDPEDQVVPKDHDDFGNRITISKKVADIVHPRMLGLDGKAYSHQVKACLLFAEHNILWEAFVIISRLRDTMYKGILPWLLNPLNVIWTQPDWESTFLSDGFGLSCLFSDGSFLKMVYNVVKFYEDELKRSIEEDFTEKQSYDTSSVSLHLFLPLLLQLLRCIHALWKAQIACNLSEELEKAKALNCEEDSQQNNARKLLDEIRECGYRIIGLCMSLNGAFDELLDCSYLTVTFIDFDSMDLLHEGRAKVSYYFGKLPGSAESIQELEHTILLQFTRDVSQIFGSSSSPELNSDLSFYCRYLLINGCFGRLRMSLFGYWVDDEAATKAIPFCRTLNLVAEYKDRENAADDFTCWLAKLKEDFYLKACCAAPEEFIGMEVEWNWEFEDEFRRYLPVYIDMLKEVDAMDNTLEKLRPEFKLKYAINDMEHPHLRTISDMRRGSNYPYSVIDHLEQNPEALPSTFDAYDVEESVHGHKDLLLWIIGQLTKAKEFEDFKPLAPEVEDFLPHLRPYAMFYILTKLKTSLYTTAEVQLHMHEEYDDYLASGKLDDYIYESMRLEGNFYEKDLDSWAVPHQFSDLDHGLIKLSLKRRAAIVQIDRQVRAYLNCLRCLMEDDLRKDRLTNLMSELEAAGFFDIDNCRINWEKKHFTELVDKVSIEVFAEHSLPRHYVIRGIIDYRTITLWRDRTQRSFEQVVGEACERLTAYLPQFWRDTRHYTHNFYEIVREPLEKVSILSFPPL
uniref:Exportin-5 C-terminal domain-containing protein n=1 Tax=Setaria italica TaxID=4555 RepID=K3YE92_SETIT